MTSTREVVIVGVTRMVDSACVGALDTQTGESLRLTRRGSAQFEPLDTSLRTGDVLEIEYLGKPYCPRPHTEDLWVGKWDKTGHFLASELTDFVLSKGKAPVWHGNYTTLFDGSLSMVDGEYLVLTRQVSPPDHSTGFWIPDENLYSYYDYFCYGRSGGSGWRDFAIKHVGIERIPSGVIRSGSLLRVSLARWWNGPYTEGEACWLQLSGMIEPSASA